VFAIFTVQVKRAVNQYQRGGNAKSDAHPLSDSGHVHDHEHDKQTQQPACEYEKILAFQAFKFCRLANPPVYIIFCHTGLEEEGT
jgi:hypothetical protein